MIPKKLWEEFIILCSDERFEPPHNFITLCGLCGNGGIIDTSKTATHGDKMVGVVGYCICPNGRARKKMAKKKLGSVVTTKADGGAYNWKIEVKKS